VQLSAGQRQLLALARAIAARPAVLLLDEATATVDGASDAAFRAALREHVLPTGTAVITIAHRLATARDADSIIVLDDGRITEQGSPEDLLRRGHRLRGAGSPRRRRMGLATSVRPAVTAASGSHEPDANAMIFDF
jgi:ATP-binding cassette subfamily B protein